MKNYNKCFTLAEIIVSLLAIGIIATLMVNVLTGMLPNKNKRLYLKAYSVLERTVKELINDQNLYPEIPGKPGFTDDENIIVNENSSVDMGELAFMFDGAKTGVKNYFKSFRPNTKFPMLLAYKLNIIPLPRDILTNPEIGKCSKTQVQNANQECRISNYIYKDEDNNWNFYTPDGVKWTIPDGVFKNIGNHNPDDPCNLGSGDVTLASEQCKMIKIDINGDKGPNETDDSYGNSKDVFRVWIHFDGGMHVIPDSMDEKFILERDKNDNASS